jgi:hypothetical protein
MSTTDDLVTQRLTAGGRVYAIGSVPASPNYPYVVIGYSPNAPVVRTALGDGDQVRRFTVQHFGRTDDAVEDVADKTFATFDGKPVAGDVCTQEIATPITRDSDDSGVLTTTHTYRF